MILKGLLTFVFSLCSAGLTRFVLSKLKKSIKDYKAERGFEEREDRFDEVGRVVFISGFIEILLYSISILVGKPEFIVFWLGVKTALRWDRKDKKKSESEVNQRATYHTYLIGTGLNIILAYISTWLVVEGEKFILLVLK